MSGPVSSALVSEAVSRTTSFLTGKYSERKSTDEYRDRLEMLRIKFKSVIEVSEAFDTVIEPLLEWEQKFKDALSETEKMLGNFNDIILLKKPNRTVEGGSPSPDQSMQEKRSDDATLVHPASNLREAVTHQVDLEANLPHDPFMKEEGSDGATLVHPASNLREAVTRHVDQEANLPHDQPMQEEGSDDATLVLPASNHLEAVIHQLELEANLPHDSFMQEEGSDDATLMNPASNLREAVPREVNLEANLPHDPFMQEEGSDDATLVNPASNLRDAISRQVNVEANLPHDPFMQEEVSDDATLVNPASNLREAVPPVVYLEEDLSNQQILEYNDIIFLRRICHSVSGLKKILTFQSIHNLLNPHINHLATCAPMLMISEALSVFARIMISQKKFLGEYLENDEKVSNLIKTVEKLEKTAGDIGDFIELLKLQSKRNMCRKRKRSGVALQGFLLVISLKLQAYSLFCYGKDPYLLVIMLFRANFNLPTGITDIFIRYIM